MTFGSLFAGIGGFDLGLERAGLTCSWQVEIDPYARRVLERHWPDVRRWDDVRTFPPADGDWGVDVICGGFPCQDISNAGKRAGINGERSGLWSEFARIIGELRPCYVLVENVAALLYRGMGRVLGDLAALGLDAEWEDLPAGAFGAPHLRHRVFVVAYPQEVARKDAILPRSKKPQGVLHGEPRRDFGISIPGSYWEAAQPGFHQVDDGISEWSCAAGALGNAVVPAIAEWLGRRLIEADTSTHEGVAG